MWPMVSPRERIERVRIERHLRGGWSQREAAELGGTSNQTWSLFEKTGRVTEAMQGAVMAAFDWPGDWAENLPPLPPPATWQLEVDRKVSELYELIAALSLRLEEVVLRAGDEHPATQTGQEQP